MKVFDSLKKKAEESKKVIVFPEGNDDRIIKAAVRLEKEGIVKPLLLGKPDEVIETAQSLNVDLGSIEIINPAVYPDFEKMCQDFVELRKGKNTLAEAKEILQDVSYFGTMLVYEGKADGMVSGATHSTANTVRPALQIIKTKKGMSRVSGAMIMERGDEKYIFADCAINIDPDSETLAEIAYQSSKTAEMIGLEPKIAMLSFSTKGSAKGPMVTKVQEATELVHQKYPDLISRDTIKECLTNINQLNICEIDVDSILLNGAITSVDVTYDANLILSDNLLDVLNSQVNNYRRFKWAHYDKEGVTIQREQRIRRISPSV